MPGAYPILQAPILVPGIRLDRDDPEEEARALRRAAEPWVAGFLLFGGHAEQVAALTRRLRERAGRPIFIASDMERGAGQQVRGLTRLPDAGLVGLGGTPADAFALGYTTAREALSVGIDVIFAPVVDVRSELDNPILGNRAFGFDPGRVGLLAGAVATGIRSAGALPVAKHFPGHGATREDSHEALPRVEAPLSTLEARDLEPFHKVVWWNACPALMTAHVAYPALDPSGSIATFSRPILDRARAFRHPEVPGLLLFTDALLMAGAALPGGEAEAGRRALLAGCDALLYPEEPEQVAAGLWRGASHAEAGVLQAEVERAAAEVARFLQLRERVRGAAQEEGDALFEMYDGANAPTRVATRAVQLAAETQIPTSPDELIVIDDDDMEDRGQVLAARAAEAGIPFQLVRVPERERPLLGEVPQAVLGMTVRALVVMASARAWKGASRVSALCSDLVEETLERMGTAGEDAIVIWCTPRPQDWRHVHLPGTGPHLEHALADVLFPDTEQLLDAFGIRKR